LLRDDDHGRSTATAPARTTPAAVHTSTALLVHTAPDGSATSITLLAVGPKGRAGHLVFLPPGAMTEIPSFGLDALGKASAFGGPTLLRATVENLLGITVDSQVVVDDAGLTALVEPA